MYRNDHELYPELELSPEFETFFEQEDESFFSWLAGIPSAAIDYLKKGSEFIAIKAAIAGGQQDENKLTNMVFFNRHPELGGKPLAQGQPGFDSLANEWLTIRDTQVRPALNASAPSPSTPSYPTPTTPSTPGSSGDIPPLDGPIKGITGTIGKSGKKIWKGAISASIIDGDAPWNKPGNRSAANYLAVLDYLNVGESDSQGTGNSILKPGENPRYQQRRNDKGNVSTYCNIYVSDATRMMWATIPHWVRSSRQKLGWNELNANDTVTWLKANGKANGWMLIDATMIKWIGEMASRKTVVPAPDNTYATNLIKEAIKMLLAPGIQTSLLSQPSYIAQLFANQGLPTACVWNNPGGIGHVAMVRPEESGKKGKISSGIFIPRSAQAGAKNYSSGPLVFGASALKGGSVLFYVHE